MIKALIFDFGNVVAHFDYARACDRLGSLIGMSGEQVLAQLRSGGFSGVLAGYESGKISTETFAEQVTSMLELEMAIEAFEQHWCDIFWLNEPLAARIPWYKRSGYRLVLGSNTNELHSRHYRVQFAATLAHFDALVLSHEVGCQKPARAFYQACVRHAGAEPAECVFIDDLAENIEGAREFGLHGIVFRDVVELEIELARLGVEPTPSS